MSTLTTEAFTIKRGDTLPAIERALKFDDGSLPPALSTASSIRFIILATDSAGDPDLTATPTIGTATAIVDDDRRVASYSWTVSDTGTVGTFLGEFEVVYPTGRLTFPNGSGQYITINVVQDLGDTP